MSVYWEPVIYEWNENKELENKELKCNNVFV